MDEHREMKEGRWERAPQMLVNVSMYRNGGIAPGETHMCDGCITVGLREAKRFVDDALRGLGALDAPAALQADPATEVERG